MPYSGEENKVSGVFGGAEFNNAGTMRNNNLPAKTGLWGRIKAFWLQDISWNQNVDLNKEIKVELTPYEQKVEDEINEFLHQEITWKKVKDFFLQEITF